jgi:hypothetical protein
MAITFCSGAGPAALILAAQYVVPSGIPVGWGGGGSGNQSLSSRRQRVARSIHAALRRRCSSAIASLASAPRRDTCSSANCLRAIGSGAGTRYFPLNAKLWRASK